MSVDGSPYRAPISRPRLPTARGVVWRVLCAILFVGTLGMPYAEHRSCNGGAFTEMSGYELLFRLPPERLAWGLMILGLVAFAAVAPFIARKMSEAHQRAGVEIGGVASALAAGGAASLSAMFEGALFDSTRPREGLYLGLLTLGAMAVQGAIWARRDLLDAAAQRARERAPPIANATPLPPIEIATTPPIEARSDTHVETEAAREASAIEEASADETRARRSPPG